jgi:2,5-diketo-D-gluconate reductase A
MSGLIRPAPTVRLLNGIEMPQLGLGTWPMNDAEAKDAVRNALDIGYRLIDTAENYGNETGVGEGIRASGVRREDVFITTKFNRQWHSVQGVRQACEASLKRLGTDIIDLLQFQARAFAAPVRSRPGAACQPDPARSHSPPR